MRSPESDTYSPPRPRGPIDLDLSRNEGRAPGHALTEGARLEPSLLARYPDLDALRADLAATVGVAAERVLVTAGGDDALLRVCLAHLAGGGEALLATPTFEMIPRYARLAGGRLREVSWPGGSFPIDEMVGAVNERTRVAFLVTPNNPTGAVAARDDLERLAAAVTDGLVVLDAAYGEFADEDLTPAAFELDNVVTVRTLSKAWGLAGLRVGYAVGTPARLAPLAAAGNPFPVSSASAALARRRLATGADEVAAYVARAREERASLAALFEELGARPVPSSANFVLARGVDALALADATAALGVAIRAFPDTPGLEDAVRVTCPGDPDDYARLEKTLRAALLSPSEPETRP